MFIVVGHNIRADGTFGDRLPPGDCSCLKFISWADKNGQLPHG